jgi:hypothetical protein
MLSLDYGPAAQQFTQHMQAFHGLLLLTADQAVQQSLEEAGRMLDATVPVDTGRLRASRTTVHKLRPLTWATGYTVDYAPVLEYGGYPRVGPKTVHLGGGEIGAGFTGGPGVYSKQAPLGWVRRALAAHRDPFLARVQTAVKQAWTGQMAGTTTTAPGPTLGPGGLSELFGIEIV